MQQDKPLQYFVVRSPFVELLLTGVKTFEFRTNAKTFANKRLALAGLRNIIRFSIIQGVNKYAARS